ncbi:MAG: anthranilate synthase component I family protein [Planctomycetota bacterium]|nr:MAG: anthranilate synthase component I family protein [Planctomycetota bacterium]
MSVFRVRTLRRLDGAPDPGRLLSALPPGSRPVLLDSSDGCGWTVLAWSPDRIRSGCLQPDDPVDPGRALAAVAGGEEWRRDEPEPPLAGGWLGFLGFECGHAWESFPWRPPAPGGLPDFHFARYRRALVWAPDRSLRLLWAEPVGASGAAAERRQVEEDCRRLLAAGDPGLEGGWLSAPPRSRIPAARYRAAVSELRARIGRGELYQANLSHRLEGPAPERPRALYRLLRREQPTAMSAYWEDGAGRALLSWSPERFLRVRGAEVETRPIKGTAPRDGDAAEDRRLAAGLERSAKERAELTMIVDMARNDLGRIALPGSVRVPSSGRIESLPTVHQRVATVTARWDPALGPARLLAATFPPASVTGAPKVAALAAITELEEEARGPYCGSFLAWEPGEPRLDASVLIRTAVVAGGRLHLRVGAGIVWDSDPEREWQETLWKARFLAAAAARPEEAPA